MFLATIAGVEDGADPSTFNLLVTIAVVLLCVALAVWIWKNRR